MVGLFGQVWFLCAIAFLAGSAVTWLVFVREPPRRPPLPLPPPTEIAPWARDPAVESKPRPEPPPVPPPRVERALANLDTHRAEAPRRGRTGSAAAGALDRLGVAGAPSGDETATHAAPEIPEQGGPVDDEPRPRDGER